MYRRLNGTGVDLEVMAKRRSLSLHETETPLSTLEPIKHWLNTEFDI